MIGRKIYLGNLDRAILNKTFGHSIQVQFVDGAELPIEGEEV